MGNNSSFCFRNTPFRFIKWIKNQTTGTTSRSNTNNFAQVFSFHVYPPFWQALTPVSAMRSSLTKDLEDSRSWTAVSQAIDQFLWCPADNTLFPKAHRNQALDPPNIDKASNTWGGLRSCCFYWYCKGKLDLHSWREFKIPLSQKDRASQSKLTIVHFILFCISQTVASLANLFCYWVCHCSGLVSWGSFSPPSFWFHYNSPWLTRHTLH